MISATDHLPGAGRRDSSVFFLPLISAASFLGVDCCTRNGSWPSILLNMRSVYCCQKVFCINVSFRAVWTRFDLNPCYASLFVVVGFRSFQSGTAEQMAHRPF